MQQLQTEPGRFSNASELNALLEAFARYMPLASAIESFWLDPKSRQAQSWSAHRDINEVMLATSLVPEGYPDQSLLSDCDTHYLNSGFDRARSRLV
ncbi:MAG: hypothetical protein H7Z14_10995 [Anaerolineae bacterium]|nr:hypothetical protein [Phycisphaerae bacterium]